MARRNTTGSIMLASAVTASLGVALTTAPLAHAEGYGSVIEYTSIAGDCAVDAVYYEGTGDGANPDPGSIQITDDTGRQYDIDASSRFTGVTPGNRVFTYVGNVDGEMKFISDAQVTVEACASTPTTYPGADNLFGITLGATCIKNDRSNGYELKVDGTKSVGPEGSPEGTTIMVETNVDDPAYVEGIDYVKGEVSTFTVGPNLGDKFSVYVHINELAGDEYIGEGDVVTTCSEPTVEPTVTTSPTQTATSSPTATATSTATSTSTSTTSPTTTDPPQTPGTGVYDTPGYHTVNGRNWFTSCEPYSQTTRCRTNIWATTVQYRSGSYEQTNGWVFNNLTYLSAKRELWAGNRLAYTNNWTASDGRRWSTECDSPKTGRGGCRSYAEANVIASTPSGYKHVKKFIFNNMVRLSN